MRPRLVVYILCGIVLAGAIVVVGRWERGRAARHANAEMRQVFDAVGDSPAGLRISGYRYGPPNCLSYEVAPVTYALQLCFDPEGRLVETVDRRWGKPVYASLTWEPSLAAIREQPREIATLLKRASSPPSVRSRARHGR